MYVTENMGQRPELTPAELHRAIADGSQQLAARISEEASGPSDLSKLSDSDQELLALLQSTDGDFESWCKIVSSLGKVPAVAATLGVVQLVIPIWENAGGEKRLLEAINAIMSWLLDHRRDLQERFRGYEDVSRELAWQDDQVLPRPHELVARGVSEVLSAIGRDFEKSQFQWELVSAMEYCASAVSHAEYGVDWDGGVDHDSEAKVRHAAYESLVWWMTSQVSQDK